MLCFVPLFYALERVTIDGVTAPIYLDHHATTPVDPRVLEVMLPYFGEKHGNAGSTHCFGDEASEAVDHARGQIAAAIGANPIEIVVTSGATESNNLAIRGLADRKRRRGSHIVSVRTEHPAVLEPLEVLSGRGFDVTLLDVEAQGSPRAGMLDPQQVDAAIRDDTCLVSVMLANNEIGIIQPIQEIAEVCRARGVAMHCDATQAVGRVPVDVRELGVDLMSFTAHKLYGPKGVGALFVRRGKPLTRMEPQIVGGGQEQRRRSGTLNVPGIVGFGEALRLSQKSLDDDAKRLSSLRNNLAERLLAAVAGSEVLGPSLREKSAKGTPIRLPGNLNILFPGLDGEAMMLAMPRLAVSSGAACSSANPQPSHVLTALGLDEDRARCSLRFGLGTFTTAEEIQRAVEMIAEAAKKLRG